MRIDLYNYYHETMVSLNVRSNKLSNYQMKRARKVLCGIKDCQCGGSAGEQGFQRWGIERDGTVYDRTEPI